MTMYYDQRKVIQYNSPKPSKWVQSILISYLFEHSGKVNNEWATISSVNSLTQVIKMVFNKYTFLGSHYIEFNLEIVQFISSAKVFTEAWFRQFCYNAIVVFLRNLVCEQKMCKTITMRKMGTCAKEICKKHSAPTPPRIFKNNGLFNSYEFIFGTKAVCYII